MLFLIQHEMDYEPTYLCTQDNDTQDNDTQDNELLEKSACVTFGTGIPVKLRLQAAALMQEFLHRHWEDFQNE
jgi:hypothetical protein